MREPHGQQVGIHVRPERCSRVRFAGSRCRRCVDACPVQAIRIGDDLLRIDRSCMGCRLCIPACPNEAFSQGPPAPGPGDGPDLLYCSALLAGKAKTRPAETPPFVTPCVGSIPACRILERLLRSKTPLEIVTGPCDSCPLKAGERSFRDSENEIRALLGLLGCESVPLRVRSATGGDKADLLQALGGHQRRLEERRAMSRRDLFLRLRERVLSRGVPGQDPVSAPPGRPGPNRYMRRVIAVVQARLTDEIRPRKIPFLREVAVGEACTGCGLCADLCPTGALSMGGDRGRPELLWKPAHCSRCDLCLEACPREAIRFLPGVEAERVARETATSLRRFHRHLCPECGDAFLSPGPDARCPGCSKREKCVEDLVEMIYKGTC